MTTTWTPRPPSSDEPACWSWPVPPVLDIDAEVERIAAAQAHLPIDERRSLEAVRFVISTNPDGHRLETFQEGRCAICGSTRGRQVLDHCHDTGQVRAWCCVGCNALEGKSGHPVFKLYRVAHPAAILDLHLPHDDGIAWRRGWNIMEHGADLRAQGPRPPTPWPAIDLDRVLTGP